MTLSAVFSTSDNSSRDPFELWVCHGHFTQVLPWSVSRTTQLAVADSLLCLWKDVGQLLLSSTFGMLQMWQERIWKSWWHICPLDFLRELQFSDHSASNYAAFSMSLNTQLLFIFLFLTHGGRQEGYFCKLKLMVMKRRKWLCYLFAFHFFLPSPSVFFFLKKYFPNLFQLLNVTLNLNYTP